MNTIDPELTPKEYFDELIQSFPDLRSAIMDEDDDMVYCRMECFATYTIEQILSSNWVKLQSCFSFQEQRMSRMNFDLTNALNVSYFEALLLGEVHKSMAKVVEYMGPLVRQGYADYHNYYQELVEKSRNLDKS